MLFIFNMFYFKCQELSDTLISSLKITNMILYAYFAQINQICLIIIFYKKRKLLSTYIHQKNI